MINFDTCSKLLKEALTMLAHEKKKQIEYNGPGCISCDLLNDFDHAYQLILKEYKGNLNNSQLAGLKELSDLMDTGNEDDHECFNNEVLTNHYWNAVRELSKKTLKLFEWDLVEFKKPFKSEPGVWRISLI